MNGSLFVRAQFSTAVAPIDGLISNKRRTELPWYIQDFRNILVQDKKFMIEWKISEEKKPLICLNGVRWYTLYANRIIRFWLIRREGDQA